MREDVRGKCKVERRLARTRPRAEQCTIARDGLNVGNEMEEVFGSENDVGEGDAVHVLVGMHLSRLEQDHAASANRIRAVGGLMLGHAFEDDNELVDFVEVWGDGISDRGEGEAQRE